MQLLRTLSLFALLSNVHSFPLFSRNSIVSSVLRRKWSECQATSPPLYENKELIPLLPEEYKQLNQLLKPVHDDDEEDEDDDEEDEENEEEEEDEEEEKEEEETEEDKYVKKETKKEEKDKKKGKQQKQTQKQGKKNANLKKKKVNKQQQRTNEMIHGSATPVLTHDNNTTSVFSPKKTYSPYRTKEWYQQRAKDYTDQGHKTPKEETDRILAHLKSFLSSSSSSSSSFSSSSSSSREDTTKSKNFEVVKSDLTFADVGGCEGVKSELRQCVELLTNHTKYARFNVRVPKGLILEGPPGTGKTMIAKAFAGECNLPFIPVSGAEFQQKYVGVGAARVKELVTLASDNAPCVIFIDEIDAIGRKRSGDGESATSEKDNTLNQLLVSMDGFKALSGVFFMGATNRVDLLDPALLRPGRMDKHIYMGYPDLATRLEVLRIHAKGKPISFELNRLGELTNGFSNAQIENLLNEAMLFALRENREIMDYADIDICLNRIIGGQSNIAHVLTSDLIKQIAIHEMGHALVGMLCPNHAPLSRVVINLSSPTSPGYTIFESGQSSAFPSRDSLFQRLMVLLAGRIAEELFYGTLVTTGAHNDFKEAHHLGRQMITTYGFGENYIYPEDSEKYREVIDDEVFALLNTAYTNTHTLLADKKALMETCCLRLVETHLLERREIEALMLSETNENTTKNDPREEGKGEEQGNEDILHVDTTNLFFF